MLEKIKSDERSIIDVLKSATAELNNLGATELDAALSEFRKAQESAKKRLEDAASAARAALTQLASDAGEIAARLKADFFGPAPVQEQQTAPVRQQAEAQDACPDCGKAGCPQDCVELAIAAYEASRATPAVGSEPVAIPPAAHTCFGDHCPVCKPEPLTPSVDPPAVAVLPSFDAPAPADAETNKVIEASSTNEERHGHVAVAANSPVVQQQQEPREVQPDGEALLREMQAHAKPARRQGGRRKNT